MDNRVRILDAAARVYAEFGYRGATTRRIATAAGVNEVTLFRTFGSKAALLDEAMRLRASMHAAAGEGAAYLPDTPRDPEAELTAWAAAQLEQLRQWRALIRKAMGEFEERPKAAPCATEPWAEASSELRTYLGRLGDAGLVDWVGVDGDPPTVRRPRRSPHAAGGGAGAGGGGTAARGGLALVPRNEDADAAATMFMASLFSDAMGRDVRPELYPQPADRAPALYVKLFLRAIACRPRVPEARARRVRGRVRSGGRTSTDRT
jgi:AcrR family transcriptional regulator